MIYRHKISKGVFYSVQARQEAQDNNSYWLIDAIASHINSNVFKAACQKSERFRDLSIWVLTPNGNGGAILQAVEDTNAAAMSRPAVRQEIEFTDFPFKNGKPYKLYVGPTTVEDAAGKPTPGWLIFHPEEY